jgi:hypothetical protein
MTGRAETERLEAARETAIGALAFLAADMERLEPFLALTGLQPGNLRAAAAEPGFFAAVLEYLTSDEKLLLEFAASRKVDPASVALARDRLAGPPADWGP